MRLGPRRRDERGAATVLEMIFVVGILLLPTLMGLAQVPRWIDARSTAELAAQEAARQAVLAADAASSVEALDTREPDSAIDHMDVLAVHDHEVEQVDHLDQLSDLLSHLSERDRRIVTLRFAERKTQSEIAEIEGISQMHVSRLLRGAFETMRAAADVAD